MLFILYGYPEDVSLSEVNDDIHEHSRQINVILRS